MPIGPNRRCWTSSTSLPADRRLRPSSSSASAGRSCWRRGPRGRRRPVQLAPVDEAASRRVLAGQPALGDAPTRAHRRASAREPAVPGAARRPTSPERRGRRAPAAPACALIAARLDALGADASAVDRGGGGRGRRVPRRRTGALVPRSAGAVGARASRSSSRRELLLPAVLLIAGRAGVWLPARAGPRRGYASDAADDPCRAPIAAWPPGSRIWAPRCPRRSARVAAQLERAHGAGSALRHAAGAAWTRWRVAPPSGSRRRPREVHRRGDLPSEIAFLDRALALLGRTTAPAPSCCRRSGRRCSKPAASTVPPRWPTRPSPPAGRPRAGSLARGGRARTPARLRIRSPWIPARRSSSPSAPPTALEELGDDARRRAGALPDLRARSGSGARSERALQNAREVVRLARLADDAVELDAGVSYVALGPRRQPRAGVRRAHGVRGAPARGRPGVATRSSACAASPRCCDAMEGRLRRRPHAARPVTRRPGRPRAAAGLDLDGHVRRLRRDAGRRPGRRGGHARRGRAHRARHRRPLVPLDDPGRPRARAARRRRLADEAAAGVARSRSVPAPNDARVGHQTPRGPGQARGSRGRRRARAGARPARRSRWRTPTEMFLFRADAARDLAEVARRVGAREEAARARAVALEPLSGEGNLAAAAQLAAARRAPSR